MLSDLYAMGVVSCHNMLMLLGVSKDFTDEERDIVVPLLMKGFQVIIGIVTCHKRLMMLKDSKEFTEQERDVVVPLIMGVVSYHNILMLLGVQVSQAMV